MCRVAPARAVSWAPGRSGRERIPPRPRPPALGLQHACVVLWIAGLDTHRGARMRVYISVDMEGVAGVVHEDQTDPIDPRHAGEYNRFRRLMTNEANAAIEGAIAAGATTVLVNDSHWLMRNLLAEELHPAAELLSGGPKLHSMVEGIDGGFD